jgi:PEGA domain/Protein of unknown function (DUF3300)
MWKITTECHPRLVLSTVLMVLAGGISAFAQNGKLNLRVTPKQAYIFVDDRAISEASKHRSLNLSAGDHKIELENYGYQPLTRTVTIIAGKTTNLEVTLETVVAKVSTTPQQTLTKQDSTVIVQPASGGIVYVAASDPWLAYGDPIMTWPKWYPYPGIWNGGPYLSSGVGQGIGFFGGYGRGWPHWGFDWQDRLVIHDGHVLFRE